MGKEVSRRGYAKYAGVGIVVIAVAGAGAYYATRPPTSTPTIKPTVTPTQTPTPTKSTTTPKPTPWTLKTAATPYKGATLNTLFISGEHDETAAVDRKQEWVSDTGIDFTVTANDFPTMLGKITSEIQSKEPTFDIVPIFSFFEVSMAKSMEPLQKYFDDPKLADPDFDFNDLMGPYMDFECIWNMEEDVPADLSKSGEGTLIAFPGPHSGTSGFLLYRQDLFEKNNLKPPETWDDYNKAAAILHDPKNGVYGSNMIASVADIAIMDTEWHNRLISMGGQMFKGSKIDKNVEPLVDSKISIDAAENLLETSKYCAPGFEGFAFTEAVNLMAAGKVGVWQSWNTVATILYNPELSKIADTIGSGPTPGTGDTRGVTTLAGNSMGMPNFVKNKEATFLWLQWYTSKDMDSYRTDKWALSPVRWSTLKDPVLIKKYPFFPAMEETFRKAAPLQVIQFPSSMDMIDVMMRNLNAMLIGKMDPETAMQTSNDEIREILVKDGVTSA